MAVQDTKTERILRRLLERPQLYSNHQPGLSTALTNAPPSVLTSISTFPREHDFEGFYEPYSL